MQRVFSQVPKLFPGMMEEYKEIQNPRIMKELMLYHWQSSFTEGKGLIDSKVHWT
jgi:hypothetical protein